jgi:hypothetical protein
MTTQTHLAVALMTAHLLADFVLQTRRMAQRKTNVLVLLGHALVVAGLSYGLAGAWIAWEIPAVILVTHAAVDYIKVRSKRHGLIAFALDQTAHVAVIAVLVRRLPLTPAALHWVGRLGDGVSSALVVVAGVIVATKVAGVVIEKVIRPFQEQLSTASDDRGFLAGGETIGRLERFLVFLFILSDEAGAIGFLIAAKSLLRFSELRGGHRKEAEYVIIGTMWSLACGLLAALATRVLLGRM